MPQDFKTAFLWYERAAQQGNPVAQARLARFYAAGEGTKKNIVEAAKWRALARRQGLKDETLDNLLAGADKEKIAQGEEWAKVWPAAPAFSQADN